MLGGMSPPRGERDMDGQHCTATRGHKGLHFAHRAPEGPRSFDGKGVRFKAIPHPVFMTIGNLCVNEGMEEER